MPIPDHLFIGVEGHLYDTRVIEWHKQKPLRRNYRFTHAAIESVADLKATLRNGARTWPGCYPLYFVTSDGGALAFATVRKNLANVIDSIQGKHRDGWRVVACGVNWEDPDLTDDHTGQRIKAAYGED